MGILRRYNGTAWVTAAVQERVAGAWTSATATVLNGGVTNTVDVRSFGAVCNGTTDDTSAVQAAANASVGKTLYFPVGTCRIFSVNISSGTKVTGEGPTSVIKQLTLPSGDPRPVFDVGNNVTITNVKIDGNRVANRPNRWSDSYCDAGRGYKNSPAGGRGRGYRCGIRGESITGLTVDNVELTAIAGAAVATNNSSSVTLVNSNIHDTDFEAACVFGDGNPVIAISGTNINIVNNTITNLESPDAAGDVQPNGIVISRAIGGSVSGNTVNGTDRNSLKLESCQDFIVTNNTMALGRIGYPTISVQPMFNRHDLHSVNIRVTGNRLSGPGFWNGVQVNSSSTQTLVARNIEVDNNVITSKTAGGSPGSGTGHMRFGVLMDGTTGLDDISVHDNTIINTAEYAIHVNGGGIGLSLQDNTHNGVAMANLSIPGSFTSSIGGRN